MQKIDNYCHKADKNQFFRYFCSLNLLHQKNQNKYFNEKT